ncbi:MAG TPA: GNAT family N-acetyltransferase [Dyella sp.]|uniref:GNAT family N-acetyltransferase n=1 Tax=Dyella sp. TaxID=1869338 RepID=UPI002D771D25|nr:GNAT family N-acetyltransferase [Dyella sp.]HET6555142.1 GNAT family N-acetyltransferase [Dyella sp.]
MKLNIHPATPERWNALEDLFGRQGACNGCWCMYWRIGSLYHRRPREENKAALRDIVEQGPPPGLLAFDGERAVGWCQLTPRADLPWLDGGKARIAVDAVPVWSISCFYVRRGYRNKGVTRALIKAAVDAARRAGAPAIEAYPWDTTEHNIGAFTGIASTFVRAGFKEVARHQRNRPIMRRRFRSSRQRDTSV